MGIPFLRVKIKSTFEGVRLIGFLVGGTWLATACIGAVWLGRGRASSGMLTVVLVTVGDR
jgi:hypothetical protein